MNRHFRVVECSFGSAESKDRFWPVPDRREERNLLLALFQALPNWECPYIAIPTPCYGLFRRPGCESSGPFHLHVLRDFRMHGLSLSMMSLWRAGLRSLVVGAIRGRVGRRAINTLILVRMALLELAGKARCPGEEGVSPVKRPVFSRVSARVIAVQSSPRYHVYL